MDTINLTLGNLSAAAALVALVLAVSRALRLNLERSILVSALRAAVQLFFLGYVLLVPIFSAGSPLPVFELATFEPWRVQQKN